MVWYFNFCAPTIPNDPTINFHRVFQTASLATFLIFYVIYHTFNKTCISGTESQKENKKDNSSDEKNSNEKSQNEQNSQNDEKKSVSIAEKINNRNFGEENQSYISFKSSVKKRKNKDSQTTDLEEKKGSKKDDFVYEIEAYFPIVFGHHAIAMGISIMYSPYAEQSIAAVLYVIFSLILAIANQKRWIKMTYGVWIWMALLNIFIMLSALLQIGQSNWDTVNKMCFAEQYTTLY